MNFWRTLVSAEDNVSSKRFAGLCLIAQYVICTILAVIFGEISEPVESLTKAGLYTGGGLLGLGMAKEVLTTVKRVIPVVVKKKKEDEDK